VLVLLAAILLLGARMSHELHDDAGALRGIGCALTHDSKVFCFMGGGNTAFEVEWAISTKYGQCGAYIERLLCPSEGNSALATLPTMRRYALPVLSHPSSVIRHP